VVLTGGRRAACLSPP